MSTRTVLTGLLLALLCSTAMHANADEPSGPAMPAWDQLSEAQREVLVAPVRERWDRDPGSRARIYERAVRWKSMTPEQRARAHRGIKRWEHMDPGRRAQMKALFERTRGMPKAQRREAMALFRAMLHMPAEEREALRRQWPLMSADEREQWLLDHAARRREHGGPRRK